MNVCFIMVMSFKYRSYSCNCLLSTMANTLPNAMNKSMVEFISSARQRLETVRHCSGTMAATFPAHTLAALIHITGWEGMHENKDKLGFTGNPIN